MAAHRGKEMRSDLVIWLCNAYYRIFYLTGRVVRPLKEPAYNIFSTVLWSQRLPAGSLKKEKEGLFPPDLKRIYSEVPLSRVSS